MTLTVTTAVALTRTTVTTMWTVTRNFRSASKRSIELGLHEREKVIVLSSL